MVTVGVSVTFQSIWLLACTGLQYVCSVDSCDASYGIQKLRFVIIVVAVAVVAMSVVPFGTAG